MPCWVAAGHQTKLGHHAHDVVIPALFGDQTLAVKFLEPSGLQNYTLVGSGNLPLWPWQRPRHCTFEDHLSGRAVTIVDDLAQSDF